MSSSIEEMETILRKAPKPTPPPGLLQDLQSGISLPSPAPQVEYRLRPRSGFRRWLPAFSLALWFMICVVVLAVQQRVISGLRGENERLRAAAGNGPSVATGISKAATELEKLRADNADVLRLRSEIAQMKQQVAQLEALKAENEKLTLQLVTQAKLAQAGNQRDFIEVAADKSERIQCIQHLKQVGLAARIYANDHGDIMPSDYASMKDELPNEKVSFCPSNGARYEIMSPGEKEGDPQIVYARCSFHNNVVLMDGSGQQLGGIYKIIKRADGKFVTGRD